MKYCVEITEKDGGYAGYMPDIGLGTKVCQTEEEAVKLLRETVSTYIEAEFRRKHKPIPLPKAPVEDGDRAILVPLRSQLRILLWDTLLEQHLTQTELAKRLHLSRVQINKYFTGTGAVSVEKLEAALAALGLHADVVLGKTRDAKDQPWL